MNLPTITRKALTFVAGILSCLLMLMGMFAASRIDFRLSKALSVLFCALLILSFPLYLLSLVIRRLALIQAILAAAFIPVYYALIWRTCSELGTCGGIASVLFMTLKTPQAMAFIGIAVSSLAALALDSRAALRRNMND